MSTTSIKFPKGSEWRKWDLQVHTPESVLNNDFGDDWENYIKILFTKAVEKNIAVIGITDYFSIEGYKKVLSYLDNERKLLEIFNNDRELILKIKEILLIPNIEFRLNKIIRNDKDARRLTLHVLFPSSDELLPNVIEEHFLHDLDFAYEGDPQSPDKMMKLKISNLSLLGQRLKSEHDSFRDKSDLFVGMMNAVVDDQKVVAVLTKQVRFKNKYMIALSEEWLNLIDWDSQDHLTRKILLQKSDCVFSANEKTRNWCLGKTYPDPKDFEKEFASLKPCIWGSDAHSFDRLFEPDLKRYTWIKADPVFEGLKQIIHEPEDRVCIDDTPPHTKNRARVIESIKVENSHNWFDDNPLPLNENLVAIIGEKGAGKTALADFIALAGGDFNLKEDDPGSFVYKALKSTKQIEETIEDSVITLCWQNGDTDNITITPDFREYRNTKKVKYLSQSFIEEKCRPENANELQKEIEDIIFQHIPAQDKMNQATFKDLYELKMKSIDVKKKRCKQLVFDLNGEIYKLRDEISSLDEKKQEKTRLENEVRQLEDQKPKPTPGIEQKIEQKISLLNKRKDELSDEISGYKIKINTIEAILAKVTTLVEYIDTQMLDIKKDLEGLGLESLYDEITFSIDKPFYEKLTTIKNDLETKIKKLQGEDLKRNHKPNEKLPGGSEEEALSIDDITTSYVSTLKINKIDELLVLLESKSSMAEGKRKTIKDFEEKIENHRKKVLNLDQDIKDIENKLKPLLKTKIEIRDSAYKDYFRLLQEEKAILDNLYAPLKSKIEEEKKLEKGKIEFFARIELDVNNFFGKADNIIDFSRKGRYRRNEELLHKEIKLIADKIELGEIQDVYSLIINLRKNFEEDTDGTLINLEDQLLKGKTELDFDGWIFNVSDFSVTYSIKYKGTNIELLSPGKKGIVLLLMYLALDREGNIPLIIDQPEENLDNRSVYLHLIDYFKQAKKRRQIIVVTHNPNLVIITDTEQVIVANFDATPPANKPRIEYISGALENSYVKESLERPLLKQGIREHGVDILEGGKDAFVKRKDRYEY